MADLLRILIVDDDSSFKKILQMRLKSFMPQMQVTALSSLAEARTHLGEQSAQSYDLVILDEHLPDGRGVELLQENWFVDMAVLSVSSDNAPEIPGATLSAGATFFLSKVSISEPLFRPLVLGIIDRNKLQRELSRVKINQAVMDTIKTLVSTLRHEINNPLGAVLGAAYLMRVQNSATAEQQQAAELVESSGKRIKHVLDQLCEAVAVEPVTKGRHKVFHIPGDKPWEEDKSNG